MIINKEMLKEEVLEQLNRDIVKGRFIIDRHEIPINKAHHEDLRWYISGDSYDELNMYNCPLDKNTTYPIKAIKKKGYNLDWLKEKAGEIGVITFGVDSKMKTIDSGDIEILKDDPESISMLINGKKLKGYFTLNKKNNYWYLSKSDIDKLELAQEEFRVWIRISKLDILGRTVMAKMLTSTGERETVFGVFSDNIMEEFLERYKDGETIFLTRIWRGSIIQILNPIGEG